VLASSVEQITACESSSPTSYLPVAQAALQIHVYQPNDGDAVSGFSAGPSSDGEEIMAASVCELPSRQWEGLWDSLIFPDDTKTKLLDYIYATVLFSDANVDCKLWLTAPDALTHYIHSQHRIMESRRAPTWTTWNGKNLTLQSSRPKALYTTVTSVCPIAPFAFFYPPLTAHSYPHSRLLEINSHSLFSRWFSESGKLVQKLFGSVMDLVEDEDTFVVVLIGTFLACTQAILVSYNLCAHR
jgi:pachytene checkpoint protein 2